jgi:hypothetical protein
MVSEALQAGKKSISKCPEAVAFKPVYNCFAKKGLLL